MRQNVSKHIIHTEERINISGKLSNTYHALPIQGGLVVLEDNLPNVIQDINRMYDDHSNTQLFLNPNNTPEAMEVLRSKGFFIHEMGYGVCLKGWGTNGDPYAHDGYPKNPGVIRDLHPEPIIQVFQDYSFKEPVGVMIIDGNQREYVYMADKPGRLEKSQNFRFGDLVEAKQFTNYYNSIMVSTLQKAASGENFIDRYPAKVRPGRRFEEVIKFYEECRQETKEDAGAPTEDSRESFTAEEVKLLKEVAAAVAHLRSQES